MEITQIDAWGKQTRALDEYLTNLKRGVTTLEEFMKNHEVWLNIHPYTVTFEPTDCGFAVKFTAYIGVVAIIYFG